MSSRPKQTVLVLGAGSSVAYGYPVGNRLRSEILALDTSPQLQFATDAGLRHSAGALEEFVDVFRRSQMYSIDAFLSRRPEFSEIGKRAIAAVLLRYESVSKLSTVDPDDDWMRYFFNHVAAYGANAPDFERYAVISFNYDRLLNAYLRSAIQASMRMDPADAIGQLKALKIVHVYGSLGDLDPGSENHLEYGGTPSPNRTFTAATGIQVIPEGRDDAPSLITAQRLLLSADRICFLGFGFDHTNIQRLDAENSCKIRIIDQTGGRYRTVAATCIGLKTAEVWRAYNVFGSGNASPTSPTSLPPNFLRENCVDLLRETLALL